MRSKISGSASPREISWSWPGRPGSGKTTLSQCLAGVIPHFIRGEYDGEVVVAGDALNELPLPRIAGIVGYVQQAPANQLFSLTVQEDVAFGPENLGLQPSEIERRVRCSLEAVGIADLGSRLPHELSGGQQQRAVLASVLALEPDCGIFDQPVAELDPGGSRRGVFGHWCTQCRGPDRRGNRRSTVRRWRIWPPDRGPG